MNVKKLKTNGPVFNFCELAFLLVSIITFAADLVSDTFLAVEYFLDHRYVWGGISVALIVIPNFIIQVFSILWYRSDESIDRTKIAMHCILLGPIYRYLAVLVDGFSSGKKKDEDAVNQIYRDQNDACMLRLFEGFLESAPQVLLQLYIITATDDQHWFTASSALISLFSLTWSVVAYSKALRQAFEPTHIVSCASLFIIFVWRSLMIASRIYILLLFASGFHAWTGLVLGIRWLVMFSWLWIQKTKFGSSFLEERLYNAVVAVIHLFMFYNVSDGKTRWRAMFYYCWSLCESCVLFLLWYFLSVERRWPVWIVATLVLGCFVLGILFMLIYYRFLHPSVGSTGIFKRRASMPLSQKTDLQVRRNDACMGVEDKLVSRSTRGNDTSLGYTIDKTLI